ncbi:hypothetical protein [Desulfonatronovibrio hydrogenovorans]|uniref:hypothetical protein n=1 Tax=Desulfonatronovibrio hydrogenovorans TaxID=53245 RepID=UPI00048DE449|nr:hypothetical protein [Desulfonatronovibrio hydrogenovorans]
MPAGFHERFGARVSLAQGGEGLFLVVSKSGDPESLVRAHGGQVVMRLSGAKLLARMALARALDLIKKPEISKVGGVHLDLERYNRFVAAQARLNKSE